MAWLSHWQIPTFRTLCDLHFRVSPPISKTLADDALQRFSSTHFIVHTERNAVAVAEIKLGKIAMQMLFLAVLINALHPALENRIVALDCVRMDIAANVLLGRVSDTPVTSELFADRFIV